MRWLSSVLQSTLLLATTLETVELWNGEAPASWAQAGCVEDVNSARCEEYFEDPDETKVYKTFTRNGVTIPISLDFYKAQVGDGPRPALVLVHGGGWTKGSRHKVQTWALRAAAEGFLVFAIDYRLACDPATVQEQELVPLCDHGSSDIPYLDEPEDVMDAIAYVRSHAAEIAGDSGQAFNGNVAVLGFSAGAHLGYLARELGTAGGSRPDAIAGWSGPTQIGLLSDGRFSWEAAHTPEERIISKGARNRLMDRARCSVSPTGEKTCSPEWKSVSPFSRVSPNPTPVFIANATTELIGLIEATAYRTKLAKRTDANVTMCKVKGTLHAAKYADVPCDNPTAVEGGEITVWDATIDFFYANGIGERPGGPAVASAAR